MPWQSKVLRVRSWGAADVASPYVPQARRFDAPAPDVLPRMKSYLGADERLPIKMGSPSPQVPYAQRVCNASEDAMFEIFGYQCFGVVQPLVSAASIPRRLCHLALLRGTPKRLQFGSRGFSHGAAICRPTVVVNSVKCRTTCVERFNSIVQPACVAFWRWGRRRSAHGG